MTQSEVVSNHGWHVPTARYSEPLGVDSGVQHAHREYALSVPPSVKSRRGMVLIAALVCLVIVMALIGGLLQGSLRARRQLHVERDRRQTELLLQAGLDRAALRLASETDYRGESWELPAESITGGGEGLVTIEASRQAEDKPWQIHVVAEYPTGSEQSVRRSRTILVQP